MWYSVLSFSANIHTKQDNGSRSLRISASLPNNKEISIWIYFSDSSLAKYTRNKTWRMLLPEHKCPEHVVIAEKIIKNELAKDKTLGVSSLGFSFTASGYLQAQDVKRR